MSEFRKVFFDMDGVLADFDRGVRELCGIEPLPQDAKRPGDYDDILWAAVRKVPNFYYQLREMDGAREMFLAVSEKYKENCEILTGVPKPKRGITTAGEDKIRWVRDYLSKDTKVNIVLREEKIKHCTGKCDILIDDYRKNIREWEAAGGTGVHHVSPENTLKRLREMGAF